MICAMSPSFADMHNTLPASQKTTTNYFIAFIVFHLICTPCLLLDPEKLDFAAWFSTFTMVIDGLVIVIWQVAPEYVTNLNTYFRHV
jgi:cytosine/uracil/thiamine/allantoin permease